MKTIFFVLGWYVLTACTMCECSLSSDFAELCAVATVNFILSGRLYYWRAWTAKKESSLNLTEFNFSDWFYPLQTQPASLHKIFRSRTRSFLYRFKTKPRTKYPLCSNLRFRSSTPERALSSPHSKISFTRTSILAPLVAGIENQSGAIPKLDRVTYLNMFSSCLPAFTFVRSVTLKSSTFRVFTHAL